MTVGIWVGVGIVSRVNSGMLVAWQFVFQALRLASDICGFTGFENRKQRIGGSGKIFFQISGTKLSRNSAFYLIR